MGFHSTLPGTPTRRSLRCKDTGPGCLQELKTVDCTMLGSMDRGSSADAPWSEKEKPPYSRRCAFNSTIDIIMGIVLPSKGSFNLVYSMPIELCLSILLDCCYE